MKINVVTDSLILGEVDFKEVANGVYILVDGRVVVLAEDGSGVVVENIRK